MAAKSCNLRIATSENWKDRNTGERRERTEWHSVAIFNEGLVRVAEQYLRKGSKVYLEGQLQTRKWQDQSAGQDRYSTEVVLQGFGSTLVMLDGRGEGGVAAVAVVMAVAKPEAAGTETPMAVRPVPRHRHRHRAESTTTRFRSKQIGDTT